MLVHKVAPSRISVFGLMNIFETLSVSTIFCLIGLVSTAIS